MNEIVNKFLLVGDKFIPEFTYSACGPFTRKKERIEKFMQTGNTDFIYRNELDKACFEHDMAYGKSKDLAKRTQSDKVLRDKAFRIASDLNMMDYLPWFTSILIKRLVEVVLTLEQIMKSQMKFIGRLLENLKDKNFIHLLETIFGVLI